MSDTTTPIDLSTLRDGDIVRARRGPHAVLEGYWQGGRIFDGNPGSLVIVNVAASFDRDAWTITDVLRPVLVKGDRVEWTNVATPKQGIYVEPDDRSPSWCPALSIVTVDGHDILVETSQLTRLPAAPEPAPIEVGDWYQNNATGSVSVVIKVDPYQVTLRHIKGSSAIVATLRLRDNWTKLDGPPEPPPGSVYVIGRQVWQHTSVGHERIGSTLCGPWDHGVKTLYSPKQLATLRILGTVE